MTNALRRLLACLMVATTAQVADAGDSASDSAPGSPPAVGSPPALGSQPAVGSQPNVVFILTDDLGWGDLGLFWQNDSGHAQTHRTPQLDRLGSAGLQMRAHYCPAPVCAPSRASLLTGLHQGNAVVRDNQFDRALEDGPTLGSVLQAAGYRTALVGKYGLQGGKKSKQQTGTPDDWPAYPTRRGFDEFFGYVSHYAGHLHYPNDPWPLANDGHKALPNLWASHVGEQGETHEEISEQLDGCYTTDLFTARAKRFVVEQAQAGQPFFLMLAYDTPHAALQVPAMPYPAGGGVDGGVQWTGQPGAMINTAGEPDSFLHPDYADRGWPDLDTRFATMVRRIDTCVGDLQQTLVDLGIAENTLVIFTSDNGPHHESYVDGDSWGNGAYTPQVFASYGPYDGTKRDVYEGGIRMPTLAWWPGTIAGGRVDAQPSQFHDWMATFCDLAGVPIPARCDGVSLVPTLTGRGEQPPSTVYIEYFQKSATPKYDDFAPSRRGRKRGQMQVLFQQDDGGRMLKGLRVGIASGDDPFEVYDAEADPDEATNLAAGGTSPVDFGRLVNLLRHPSPDAKRPYDDQPVPAADGPFDGLQMARQAGEFAWLPRLDGRAMQRVVSANDATNASLTIPAGEIGAARVRFSVIAPQTGRFRLTVDCPQPFLLRLGEWTRPGGGLLIDGETGFNEGEPLSTERVFERGVHILELTTRVGSDELRPQVSLEPID